MSYPFHRQMHSVATDFDNGNFGLWFNKMVPLDGGYKVCAPPKWQKNVIGFYVSMYERMKKNVTLEKLLTRKHEDQKRFCRLHAGMGMAAIEIRAELESQLITGIGQSHPNEVGMTFDHTMGIPYLPASAVKGVVRLAHILNLIENGVAAPFIDGDELDDTHPASLIPTLFGGDRKEGDTEEKCRGKVVFLDAYPERTPGLHADIMNPHYGPYYGDDAGNKPPADYLDPNPVQFLTVKSGTTYVFRAIVAGDDILAAAASRAFQTGLLELGFGAKTASGYGRFSTSHAGKGLAGSKTPGAANPSMPDGKSPEESRDSGRTEDRIGMNETALQSFCQSLPDSAGLPGRASEFVGRIEAIGEAGLKKACAQALLDAARSNRRQFNRACRAGKKWALDIVRICEATGVKSD